MRYELVARINKTQEQIKALNAAKKLPKEEQKIVLRGVVGNAEDYLTDLLIFLRKLHQEIYQKP